MKACRQCLVKWKFCSSLEEARLVPPLVSVGMSEVAEVGVREELRAGGSYKSFGLLILSIVLVFIWVINWSCLVDRDRNETCNLPV